MSNAECVMGGLVTAALRDELLFKCRSGGCYPPGRCMNEIHTKLPQALPKWRDLEDYEL